jgi:hypothetical protein
MATDSSEQPFARDQGKPFTTGPFLGGYIFVTTAAIAAGGNIAISHTLRVAPRHAEVIAQIIGEYPSRVTFTAKTATTATIKFESAQSIGASIWLW